MREKVGWRSEHTRIVQRAVWRERRCSSAGLSDRPVLRWWMVGLLAPAWVGWAFSLKTIKSWAILLQDVSGGGLWALALQEWKWMACVVIWFGLIVVVYSDKRRDKENDVGH